MCCYCNEQRFHHRPSSESPASLHGSLSHYRGRSHFHHKTSHECFSQPLCFLIEAVQMSVVLALSLTFMYFHQSLRNTACAGFSLRWWVGMFYTHSDKPRILAAPLNCLRDIHVWAASIRQWGSIAFNSKYIIIIHLSFIQQKLFTCSVMADSLWPHGLQHAKLPCPSPTSGAYSNSVPLSQWCHSTSSSSVIPFSSCFQSFSASESFPMSQLFTSGGQSIGTSASASASVLLMIIHNWFPLGWTVLISLQSKGLESLL